MAGRRQRNRLIDTRLATVQRFRRRTVASLRGLDVDELAAHMATEPHGPYLSPRQLRGLEERRQHAIAHIDALIARHGDAVTPW